MLSLPARFPRVSAALLGMLAVTGYAPFQLYPLSVVALAGLFLLLQRAGGQSFALGYCYGLGLYGAGVSWIFVSLHDFGGMPAAGAMLATALLCAFLALFPGLACRLGARFSRTRLLALPAAWTLSEWVLNWIFTGFPWLTLGYSQAPASPLAGFAPVVGVFGVSLCTAACAALIAWLAEVWQTPRLRRFGIGALLALWVAGSLLKQVAWSEPVGPPLSVSLLQGNIAQDMKWEASEIDRTLRTYHDLAMQYPAQLIVMPETALPLLLHHVPEDYLRRLRQIATEQGGDLLLGVPEQENGLYFNSMVSLGSAPSQIYRKSHLVPFGEFIPFKSALGWIYRDWLHIPLADLAPGAAVQQPLRIAGQMVAVNICYEDVFGEEIIRQLPEATLLVNASNDAWYGRSLAAHQHLQISQMRALESGRMMLRATNTGATAIIDPHGAVLAEAPHFTATALTGSARGYAGSTPFVRFGNWPAITLAMLWLGLLWVREKK
ncbi:MAG: apolipoprotein N-acyltransferase [Methylobacterium sp.]|nr:apolipoprotein N-acyltransferase [Methylobacterium sp.]